MNHTELGIFGETLAVEYMLKKGYIILDRNYRFKKWEIDIVAKDQNTIVVVEVKTRQTSELGPPWKAVSKAKQKQIIQVADHYVRSKGFYTETRFDIVSIVTNHSYRNIEHIQDAFFPVL